jgi:gliding motility-associated-like protein
MKHILCLREFHYPFKTRLLIQILLIISFLDTGLAQCLKLEIKDPVGAILCQAATTELLVSNRSNNILSNVNLILKLPGGVTYVAGSVSGAIEGNISQPSSPEFTIANLRINDSIRIKVSIMPGCDLFEKINNGESFSNKWIVSSNPCTDSVASKQNYVIETPYLVIFDYLADTTVNTGTSFKRNITISNTRLGSLKHFIYEDRHDAFDISSSSGTLITKTNVLLKLEFDADDFLKIGDRDSLFETNESITIIEDVQQTDCIEQQIRSEFITYWGCNSDSCQTATKSGIATFKRSDEEAKFLFNREPLYPSCICSDEGTPQCLIITNTGKRTAENIVITLKATDAVPPGLFATPYGIIRGSVSVSGGASIIDIQYLHHVTVGKCQTDQLFAHCVVTLSNLAPGEEVKIRFNYSTCLECAPTEDLYWYYGYSHDSKCVPNSTTASAKDTRVTMDNPADKLKTLTKIRNGQQPLEENKVYTFENFITFSKNISDQHLYITYEVPCPLRLVDTLFLLNGKAPIEKTITEHDSSFSISLVYAPPFLDTLYGTFTFIVDCDYLCYLNLRKATKVTFISSCPNEQELVPDLVSAICTEMRLSCPLNKFVCGPCANSMVAFDLKCINLPQRHDTITTYIEGAAKVYRKNYGDSDPDDDRLSDPGVLDTSLIELKKFITQDTIVHEFSTVVVVKDDLFNYDSIFFMVNSGLSHNAVYSEIKIKDISSNTTYYCVYPFSDKYMDTAEIPNCYYPVIVRKGYGSGLIVPFTPELLNKNGMNLPVGFKFENGDSINAKIIGRIGSYTGQRIVKVDITYRAFFIDRSNIKPDPYSCMIFNDSILLTTQGLKYTQEPDTLFICKSAFELFHATIQGTKELDNFFTREFRNVYSLDSLKLFIDNPELMIDSIRLDYYYKLDTSLVLIKSQKYPARFINGKFWDIDPELLKDNKYDESYTIQITPIIIIKDCARFKEQTGTVNSAFYINSNNGSSFYDIKAENKILDSITYSTSNKVKLYNGNKQLNTGLRTITNTSKNLGWDFLFGDLRIPGGFEFEIYSKNNSISNINIKSTPDAKIVKLDSTRLRVENLDVKKNYTLHFSAIHSYCKRDTILVIARWFCSADSGILRDECNQDTIPIIIIPEQPQLELGLEQADMESMLCDTLPEITLEIFNADKGSVCDLYLDVFIPPGTETIPSTLLYSYPKGSTFKLLPLPISLGSGRYRWVFADFIDSIKQNCLNGIREPRDSSNSILIKMKLLTSCNAIVHSYPRFFISGKNYCDEFANSIEKPGRLIKIKGLSSPGSFSISMQNPDLKECSEETSIRISIRKNSAAILSDSLKIILPGGLHYKLNSIVNIRNMSTMEPLIIAESGSESLYFGLLSSLQAGDSIVFTIKINGLKNILCSSQLIMALTYIRSKATCQTSHTECDVFIESGIDEIIIDQKTGSMSLDSFSITRHPDSVNYNLKFKYELKDKSLIADSLICVNLYEDLNSNNKLDPADVLIGNYQIQLNAIVQDGRYSFESKIDKSKINSCNYLLASCPDNCICQLDTLAFGLNMLKNFLFNDSLCAGASTKIGLSSTIGKKYKWIEGSVPCDTCSEVKIDFASNTSRDTIYNFTLHEIDADGCFSEYRYQIKVSSIPGAGLDTTLLCALLPGGTVILSGSGSGTWIAHPGNPGSVLITDPTSTTTEIKNFNTAGTYQFIRTNSNSCSDTVRVLVTAKPDAGPDQHISCVILPGGTAILTASGNGIWTQQTGNPGNSNITDPGAPNTTVTSFSQAGIYNYVWTNPSGCADTVNVIVSPRQDSTTIKLDPNRDSVLQPGQTVTYCVIGGKVVRWEPNIGLSCNDCPCVEITAEGDSTNYTVTVLDSFDCEHLLQFIIYLLPIRCDTSSIFIPNAFSPNNDKVNDIWLVRCPEINNIPTINKMHLGVYNRWGQKVFESFDVRYGWDGTFKGELLPPDVYGYFLEAECVGGDTFFMKGNVSLMK